MKTKKGNRKMTNTCVVGINNCKESTDCADKIGFFF